MRDAFSLSILDEEYINSGRGTSLIWVDHRDNRIKRRQCPRQPHSNALQSFSCGESCGTCRRTKKKVKKVPNQPRAATQVTIKRIVSMLSASTRLGAQSPPPRLIPVYDEEQNTNKIKTLDTIN